MGAAPEFTFVVFVMPVGPFYSGGIKPVDAIIIEDFDRSKVFFIKKKKREMKADLYYF
jgi:hypothetical protein